MTDEKGGPERDLGFPVNVEDPADLLSDYQAGRVGAVFRVGQEVEKLKEQLEGDAAKLSNIRDGITAAYIEVEKLHQQLQSDVAHNRRPIKQAEYGAVYLKKSMDVIKKLERNTVESLMRARHGAEALEQATKITKTVYDDEREKLRRQEEYLKERQKMTAQEKIRERPTGVSPGNPLEDYKREAEASAKPAKKKRTSRRKSTGRRS